MLLVTDKDRYDYFVTDASLYYANWSKSSGDTFCSDTLTCTVTSSNGTQFCQTRTSGISINIGIMSPGISVIGAGIAQFGIDYTTSLSSEACYTASNTNACEGNDGQCHTVFTQQQLVKQIGYRRQRCNWGNGDETDCMADTEIDTPTALTN